jgi:ketosteroid isomerase-like protein
MSASDVVGRFGSALGAGDMSALAGTLSLDAVWHQPGENQLSGDHVGSDAILAHLGLS